MSTLSLLTFGIFTMPPPGDTPLSCPNSPGLEGLRQNTSLHMLSLGHTACRFELSVDRMAAAACCHDTITAAGSILLLLNGKPAWRRGVGIIGHQFSKMAMVRTSILSRIGASSGVFGKSIAECAVYWTRWLSESESLKTRTSFGCISG